MTGNKAKELLNKFSEELKKPIPQNILDLLESKPNVVLEEEEIDMIEEQFMWPNSKIDEEVFRED
jgi:hypothetical protein